MTRSTRNLWVLVGTVAILSLAMSAVVPVLAQGGGTGGQSGQGTSVPLQPGDTLGTLVSRYNMTDDNLREFFTLNTDLVLQTGQTVNFPAGIIINTGAGGQGQGTTGDQTGQATGTPGPGAETTGTPDAGAGAGGAQATGTPDAGAGGATAGDQTYVTQEGDTLGVVLAAMGFTAGDDAGTTGGAAGGAGAQVTGTPEAGGAGAEATGTPGGAGAEATAVGTAPPGEATAAPGEATGTPDGGAGGAQVTGTPDAGAGGAGGAQAVTNEQLRDFVSLNSNLSFVSGQTFFLPAGVPETGQGQVTGTPAAGGAQVTGTPDAGVGGQVTGTPQVGQTYTVQAGETLTDVANRLGVTLEQLIAANPDLITTGQTLNIPAGAQGAIPQTGAARTFVIADGDTLGSIASRYNLAANDLREFFRANRDLVVDEGQTVNFPAGAGQGGTGGAIQATTTPAAGDVAATPTAGALVATTTPAAGDVAATPTAGALVATATPSAGDATGGQQGGTYVTRLGDSLEDVFEQMGVDLDATVTDQQATQDAQMLQQFVTQNSGLTMETGQTVTIPAGIPQTGGQPAGVGAAPSLAEQIRTGQRFGRLCGQAASPGTGHYLIQPGENIFSLSEKFNVAVEDIIALNPGITGFFSGQAIVLPGVEAPGQWNVEQLDESCENWFEGGGGGAVTGETAGDETTGGGETTGE